MSVIRVAIPLVTIVLVFGNASLQTRMALANAERIINACTQYRDANGTYPMTLDILVPQYLHSVPRAKYALMLGEFRYTGFNDEPTLMWVAIPPFGHWDYRFEKARWVYLG